MKHGPQVPQCGRVTDEGRTGVITDRDRS